jgi:type III secretion system FlhB-like substrate exporter
MKGLNKDFFSHLFNLLDGATAVRMSRMSKKFHTLINDDKRLVKLMKYHNIRIEHPSQFLEAIGVEDIISFKYSGPKLCQEGSRTLQTNRGLIEFNDFYWHSGSLHIPKGFKFLVITYEPLKGCERYNLGAGTIHRGTSIVLFLSEPV